MGSGADSDQATPDAVNGMTYGEVQPGDDDFDILFQPLYDIQQFARKRMGEATDEEVLACRGFTKVMEDTSELASIIFNEWWERMGRKERTGR